MGYGPLAQLAEHVTFNHGVPRSNRGWITIFYFADVAKLADASDLGSDGKPWGFKSSHPHQKKMFFKTSFFITNTIIY